MKAEKPDRKPPAGFRAACPAIKRFGLTESMAHGSLWVA